MKRAVLTAALGIAALSLLAGPASAAGTSKYAIIAPRANQVVSGIFNARPKVTARKGRFSVSVKVDGKLIKKRKGISRKQAIKRIPIDTRKLTDGPHRLSITITATSKPLRASQTIRFIVANAPAGPVGELGTPGPVPDSVPTANLKDYKLIAAESFNKDAPAGSWDPDPLPWAAPVYTGTTGVGWSAYPTSATDTWNKWPYRAKEVLSVHDNVLDFFLHPVDGKDAGASISPILPGGSQYQTYGRYSIRVRLADNLGTYYHMALLLWPQTEADAVKAESDFPETFLSTGPKTIDGYAHRGNGGSWSDQEEIHVPGIDLGEWHTFSQEWSPTNFKYFVDGNLVHATSTYTPYGKPMRWQIQVQTGSAAANQSGHLLVDWAAIWAWSPGTTAG